MDLTVANMPGGQSHSKLASSLEQKKGCKTYLNNTASGKCIALKSKSGLHRAKYLPITQLRRCKVQEIVHPPATFTVLAHNKMHILLNELQAEAF